MSDTFSKFFKIDKESPQYTACMALYIFEELRGIHLIDDKYAADYKYCRRNVDFKIPKKYNHDTQNDDVTEHCWILSYKYTGYTGISYSTKQLVKEVCRLGICEDQSDLNYIQREISSWTSKYCEKNYPLKRKSTTSHLD